jgi:hypothetical protein
MIKRFKNPLILPILMTLLVSTIAAVSFISVQNIEVNLPPTPDIQPNLSLSGSSFGGFIDITLPVNVSNRSPAILKDIRIFSTLSIVSIENFGLFPDTTLVNVSENIDTILANSFKQIIFYVRVISWIPVLAIVDAYLVFDIDVNLKVILGPFTFPFHSVIRIQNYWEAPFKP